MRRRGIGTGNARYTIDVAAKVALHLRCCARRTRMWASLDQARQGARRAWRGRSVHLGGCAAQALLTATHEDHLVDPDDTYMLDNIVRFVGQRVAAVERSPGRGEEAVGYSIRYELLPTVFDPTRHELVRRSCMEKKSVAFSDNIDVDIHGELGNVEQGFEGSRRHSRDDLSDLQSAARASRAHGWLAWRGDDGRLHVRTSSQAPFIAKQKLCYLFGLFDRDVHVFTERIGGGFGGKQEMVTEDVCALATLKLGPPGDVGIPAPGASSPAPPRATR